jgi:hypothetical protein
MGSFLGTCAVSHLPIAAGDPVKAFVLHRRSNQSTGLPLGQTSSTDSYRPVALPLSGVYNDYGWIEESQKDDGFASLAAYMAKRHAIKPPIDGLPETLNEITSDLHCYGVALVHDWMYAELVEATRRVRRHNALVGRQWDRSMRAYVSAIRWEDGVAKFHFPTESRTASELVAPVYSIFHHHMAYRTLSDYIIAHSDQPHTLLAASDMGMFLVGMTFARRILQPQSGNGMPEEFIKLHTTIARSSLAYIRQTTKGAPSV